MEVIILSSEGSQWDDNLFEFINLDFDTQFVKRSQFENLVEIIDKPVVIVCNVDTYLELQSTFEDISPIANGYSPEYPNAKPEVLAVLVVIDSVYFDPYDPRFKFNRDTKLSVSVYGNVNNIMNPQIFRNATFFDVNYDSEDFLEDIKKEIKTIDNIFKEKMEPVPKNNVEVFNVRSNTQLSSHYVPKVKIRGIFSNSKLNLSYLQKSTSK